MFTTLRVFNLLLAGYNVGLAVQWFAAGYPGRAWAVIAWSLFVAIVTGAQLRERA